MTNKGQTESYLEFQYLRAEQLLAQSLPIPTEIAMNALMAVLEERREVGCE